MFLTLSDSLKSIRDIPPKLLDVISNKSYSISFLSYPADCSCKYFCENIFKKSNLYENKNETNGIPEDMGCNLSLDHPVPLSIWGNIIRPAIVPKDMHTDAFLSSLDRVCRCAFCGFNRPSDFTCNRQKVS